VTLSCQLKHTRPERLERRECPALPEGPERPKRHRRTAAVALAALLAVSLSIGAVCLYTTAVCLHPEAVCLLTSRASAAESDPGWDADDGKTKAAVKLPAGEVQLAEIIDCEILVSAPPDAEYRIEVPRSEWLSSGIEIIGDGPARVERGDGALAPDRWNLQLMAMETGELSLLGPVIVYKSSIPGSSADRGATTDGPAGADTLDEGSSAPSQTVILQLPSRVLKVVNPLDGLDDAELRPMKDPMPARPDYRRAVAIMIAVFAGIACVAALAMVIRRWLRRKDGQEIIVPRRPAHEIAYERLRKIEEDELIERGLHRQFHFAISECLREYLENRYGVPALEMTTEEFFEYSRTRSGLPDVCRSGVVDLLNLSDLVKFAKRESMSGEMRQVLESVRRLVDQTREADDTPNADGTPSVDNTSQADEQPDTGGIPRDGDAPRAGDRPSDGHVSEAGDTSGDDGTRDAGNTSDAGDEAEVCGSREGKVIAT